MFTTDAIALASPSGRISKRALKAAQERIRRDLFGDGLNRPAPTQPPERDRDLATAQEYRRLAARGMSPRKYRKVAGELEAKWAAQ